MSERLESAEQLAASISTVAVNLNILSEPLFLLLHIGLLGSFSWPQAKGLKLCWLDKIHSFLKKGSKDVRNAKH